MDRRVTGSLRWVWRAALDDGAIIVFALFWVDIADGVIVLDVIVEIHPGDERGRAARHGIQRAVELHPLAAKYLAQGALHCRDLAGAAHHQCRLDASFVVAAFGGGVDRRANGLVDLGE